MSQIKSVSFTGRESGDMECFCWDDIPENIRRDIYGNEWHDEDKKNGRILTRLYPHDLMRYLLGLNRDESKIYKFTLTIEECTTKGE
jgi:hypothetical protein